MTSCPDCGAKNLNSSTVCSECGADSLSAKNDSQNQNENHKILDELKKISGKIEKIELKNKESVKATLQSVDIEFWSVVRLMVKWAIASIPATIIFSIIIFIVAAALATVFGTVTGGSFYLFSQ